MRRLRLLDQYRDLDWELRLTGGQHNPDPDLQGCFRIPFSRPGAYVPVAPENPAILRVMASTGEDWDHVSVSLATRVPTYEEMQHVFRLFFGDGEVAVEYHMPAALHVNRHPFTLHLWQPQSVRLPVPPEWMV